MGPAAYARAAIVTQNGVEPLVTMANSQGAIGYYSVLYVRAGDPAQSLADLKGRNLCLVDPNSASGNNVPRYAMSKLGIEPETHFGKIVYSGSHENAVIGLSQGTCDGAFNWWNTERESNLLRMAAKGMARRGLPHHLPVGPDPRLAHHHDAIGAGGAAGCDPRSLHRRRRR